MIVSKTYCNCSCVTQGTLPTRIKFSGASDDVNLLDKLLIRANKGRFTLAGEFGTISEVGLSAGSDFLPVDRVVTATA